MMASKIRGMSRSVKRDASVYFCADATVQCSALHELVSVAECAAPILVKELKQDRNLSPSTVLGAFEEGADTAPIGQTTSEKEPWFVLAAYLRDVDPGLLQVVLDTKFYDFILSEDYDCGIQSLIAAVQDVRIELPAATKRARVYAQADIAKGRPPKDYLKDAHYLDVPDCSWIPRLSQQAKDLKFEIKGDFKGSDLETAVRNRIASADFSSQVAAVRDSLLLIGEALVKVHSVLDRTDSHILPIVDARCGSHREFWLDWFISESLTADTLGPSSVMRGGVITGFRGYGKSVLIYNVIFGKALTRWALAPLGDKSSGSKPAASLASPAWMSSAPTMTHVGIYVRDPTGFIGDLRYASPVALIAAGLAKLGIINANSPPEWAMPAQLNPTLMGRWLSEHNIHVALAIDEAEKVRMPDERSRDWHYRAMASYFWNILEDMLRMREGRPTVFLTGSYQGLAKEVYGPVHGHRVLQGDKFRVNYMPNSYSEPELHLMLLRYQRRRLQPDSVYPKQLTAPLKRPLVSAADAVLALTYCLRKRDDLEIGEWWHYVGYLVQPSLDHLVRLIYSGSSIQDARKTRGAPVDRITVESAQRHLQDHRVLDAAKLARERVVRAYLLNGGLARSIGELGGTSVNFKEYVKAMMDRKTLFSRFAVALVRASVAYSAFEPAMLSLEDPFQAMPLVSVSAVKRYLEVVSNELLPPDRVASDRQYYEDILDGLLRGWHDNQWVAYYSPEEHEFKEIAPQRSGHVQLPNLAYARVALQVDLTRDIFLTVREQQALDLLTGGYGKDYELVIAESLRRNFKSKILDKGRLPSLPRDVYTSEPGVLELSWDRSSPSAPNQYLQLDGIDDGGVDGNGSLQVAYAKQFSAFGQLFKELPDRFGADLAMVLQYRTKASPYKPIYHVVRIQVNAGLSPTVLGAGNLKELLCQDTQAAAHRWYCSLLGEDQTSGNVVMHRLLITSKFVSDPVRKLASHSETRNPISVARGGKQRLGRKPEPIPQQENMDVIYGADLPELLVADARLYLARRRVLLSETEEDSREAYAVLRAVLKEVSGELALGIASEKAGTFDALNLAEARWEHRNSARQ